MRVYIDTNVLIDFVCRREKYYGEARILFALGYAKKIDLLTLALSFVTTMYVANKYDYLGVTESLLKTSKFVNIMDLKADTVLWALSSGWKDYEDATQYKEAIMALADCIVTRNKKDFKLSSIPVYTPKEILQKLGFEN